MFMPGVLQSRAVNTNGNERCTLSSLMADLLQNLPGLNLFTPRYMMKTALDVMLQSADVLKQITLENGDRLAWQEFQNKIQAFYLFEYVDLVLGLSDVAELDLKETLGRTHSLGPFFSVWATEGLGHYFSYLRTSGGHLPRNLFSDNAISWPRESMVPLHTGMGLALAEALLARTRDPQTVAENFVQLCRSNSRHEYWQAAVEALGLVICNLHSGLIAPLDNYFSKSNEQLLPYLWHGIGRGLYFAPANSLPWWSAPSQVFGWIQQAPHEVARRNAVAGFAWAMTLVNLRHPEIMARFIEQRGASLATDDAFAYGVFSSLFVWLNCAPDGSAVRSFCEYRPQQSNESLLQLWQTQIQQPGRLAFHYKNRNNPADMGTIFCYYPLVEIAREMQI
jgi:hypothetical protein